MIIIYLIAGIISIGVFILIAGLLLPTERVVTKKGLFSVSPEVLYGIVTDNTDWRYRKSLNDLIIHESKDGVEVWDEISHNGNVIRFKTREKRPSSFYSFDMDSNLFSGYWTAEFEPNDKGETIFTATEYIRVNNPFVKTISYLFFDIGKLMDEYQDDLRQKLNSK